MKACVVCGQDNHRPQSDFCSVRCSNKSYYITNSHRIIEQATIWNESNRRRRKRILNTEHSNAKAVFRTIRQRCESKTHRSYKDYGARGIKCLIDYETFAAIYFRTDECENCGCRLNDKNRNKTNGRTIDRINVNRNYESKNLRVTCKRCNNGFKSKLSPKQREKVKREYVYGSKTNGTVALGKKYGISQAVIHDIVSGKRG